jgi:flagellar biosynthesis/type III secretory pathway protein FliH
MTLTRVTLERFEDTTTEVPKSADYIRGFADGERAAQNSDAAQLTTAVESVASTLSDMAFGYEEARVQLLEKIRPLLVQLSEAVLPGLALETFSAHLIDVITRDFEAATKRPIQISVPPDTADYLEGVLSGHDGNFTFVGDIELTKGQALLHDGDTHILIDFPALILALQTALNGVEPLERSLSNG